MRESSVWSVSANSHANSHASSRLILAEADESRAGDSHAVASARIKRELACEFACEFADTDQTELSRIQTRAQTLLCAHTKEMEEKYGKQRTTVND